jgi:hypothetical protein
MLRWALRRQLDASLPRMFPDGTPPSVAVLSYRELPPETRVVQEGSIDVQVALPAGA